MTVTADEQLRRLDPRAVRLDRLVGWITTGTISGVLFVVLGIIWLSQPVPPWVALLMPAAWLTVTILSGLIAYRWPVLEYRTTSYRLDDDGIEIRTGVYWRKVIAVPRSRVQHIDVSQGPLERSYGLGTLIIFTAGTAHSRVGLSGLDHQTALFLRDRLLPANEDDAI
jgi:uncharacterized protein